MPRYQPDPIRMPHVWASTSNYQPRRRTYSDGPGLFFQIAALVVIVLVLIFVAAACSAQADDDFTRRCQAQYHGHMDKVTKYGYKSYTTTRYCLGDHGEVWMVE